MPVEVVLGDITECDVDVIVNAANSTLLGGGGVDGAILPFKAIIHTVGPIWRGGGHGEDDLLRACYENALDAAASLDAASIAFPAISTGAFGFPEDRAAGIAARTCLSWSRKNPMRILLVAFDDQSRDVLKRALEVSVRDQ